MNEKCATPDMSRDTMGGMGCRQSARGVLEQMFREQEERTVALDLLLKAIPWPLLSPQNEEILWRFFCHLR